MNPRSEFNLERGAREFADNLSRTLNRTVADGVRLSAVTVPDQKMAYLGMGLSKRHLGRPRAFPLLRAQGRPTVYMLVSYRLRSDDDRDHLMVQNSVVALGLDAEMTRELLHVDYERNKGDGYPEAHLQVVATSKAWEDVSPDRPLGRLHLPVGPRRFRPSVEDVIEFLASEGLTRHREGWRTVIDEGRLEFQKRQLRAAVRRSPDIAREVLTELDSRTEGEP